MTFFLWVKNQAITLFALFWIAFAPAQSALICVMALPLIDLLLGLICARRARRPITSSGLKRTIAKIFLYEAATLLAFVTETWLTGPMIPAIKMVTGLIGMTELKSCLEHLDELGGMPLFASLLRRLAPAPLDSPEPDAKTSYPPQEPK